MATATNPNQLPLPPGELGLPFIGERPRLFDLEYMQQQYATHGPIIKTRLLGRHIAVMMGPEASRFLLSSGMKHFAWRDGWPPMFKTLLGESLFVQDGEEARQMRRLIMPAFHQRALQGYMSTMEHFVQQYLDKWTRIGTFRWLDENKELTFAIASQLLMGSEPGQQSARLSRLFTEMTNGFVTVPVNWPWTPYGKALRARDQLLDHIESAVLQRQQDPTDDALSLMIQSRDETGKALSMRELKAQTLLMLFAGHETSASMMTSFVMALAQNPDVMARARAEQEALRIDGPLTMDHIRAMPYLEQILKEIERVYPPVPAGFRGVIEPFEFNGYYVPRGWTALYLINVTHRDERLYTDPLRFDPDRFGPERDEGSAPYSLVGFGGGSRLCIGFSFAQLEMKILGSHLLRGFDWELLPGQNINMRYNPTIAPKDGAQVRFWARN